MSKTFAYLQERYQILRGDDSVLTADATGKSHINAAVGDITSANPYSWLLKTDDLTLSSGTATMPSDYNPGFQIEDARIDTLILRQIPIQDRDNGDQDVYWITYNSATDTYIFNSNTQTGTVTIYYYYVPADMTSDSDTCVVVDPEAVAYLAASKAWIGSERNQGLKDDYGKEADRRIKAMVQQDFEFGPTFTEGSILDYNNLR